MSKTVIDNTEVIKWMKEYRDNVLTYHIYHDLMMLDLKDLLNGL